jgi:hypothetical protein
MFDIKYYVMKIMSKSLSQHVVGLQGKLKQTEKEKNYMFVGFFMFFNIPVY